MSDFRGCSVLPPLPLRERVGVRGESALKTMSALRFTRPLTLALSREGRGDGLARICT